MADTITLATIRTESRQRADMENSEFITDSELNTFINQSYAELYDLLVSRFEDYYTTSTTFTLSAGSNTYALPSDFYKLRGLDYASSGTNYIPVYKYNFSDRNRRNRSVNRLIGRQFDIRYRILGNTLTMTPEDGAAGNYRLWYTPRITRLSSDSDTLDSVNGWHEYVVVDAARKMLLKEESSTTALDREKQALIERIEAMAANRDDQPETITDTQSWDNFYQYPYSE